MRDLLRVFPAAKGSIRIWQELRYILQQAPQFIERLFVVVRRCKRLRGTCFDAKLVLKFICFSDVSRVAGINERSDDYHNIIRAKFVPGQFIRS